MQRPSRQNAIYWALLAASFAVALTASWTSFGAQIDNDAYDWMFRLYQPPTWQPESILLVIDEASLNAYGGLPGPSRQNAIYWALLASSFAMALTASWTSFGAQIDNDAYDGMFRLYQPPTWQPESILLVIEAEHPDRKSTRLNSSHLVISYAVFCLKKKKNKKEYQKYKSIDTSN